MNVTYKLTKNKNGQTVVASELAKGHKKNARIAASALLLTSLVSIGYSVDDLTISGHYAPAEFIYGDSSNPKKATDYKNINNSQTGTHNIINKDINIKFGNITTADVQPNIVLRSYSLSELFNQGFIKIYDRQSNSELTDIPT